MKSYIIQGGKKLSGTIAISGSKNVVLKLIIAACLTEEEVEIKNAPAISDLYIMLDLVKGIGGEVKISASSIKIRIPQITDIKIPLESGGKIRTSSMFLAPLLARKGEALIPNPGGCRIGARPIDRHIKGLEQMNVNIDYKSDDGYFHARTTGLIGTTFRFEKNSHTGTETLLIAAALAKGITIIENAAKEPEVDDLISFLNQMGAKIQRVNDTIKIVGVEKLHGVSYSVMPDRNEAVTFAVLGAVTGGKVWVKYADLQHIKAFLDKFREAGGDWEEKDSLVRFFIKDIIKPVNVTTEPHPGFMTDWQGPWSVLMTQAKGESVLHEAVYENRFGYADQYEKMGVKVELFNPSLANPEEFYNFNWDSESQQYKHALKIHGSASLHNAVLNITDLRAGATLVIAALIAKGKSAIYGVEYIERGYEAFPQRLKKIGADIEVIEDNT